MDDLISRAEAIDALKRKQDDGKGDLSRFYNTIIQHDIEAIMQLPPIQPAEPKRGKWISADAIFGGVPFYCSECGENTRDTVMGKPRWSFCPNCGCRMDGGE